MDARIPATEVLPFRDDVRSLVGRVEAHGGPIVSLYLDVHADTDPKAPQQRADAALRELGLSREDREAIEQRLERAFQEVGEGYWAVFSAPNPDDLFEHRLLRTAPPLPGGRQEYLSRLGDPLTAPLHLLLAADPPAIVTYVDERRARIFVVDLGDVRETASSVRAMNTEEWRNYTHKGTGDPGQIASSGVGRAGSGRDQFEARAEAWTERFTKALAERLADEVASRDGAQLVLLGEPGRAEQVHESLPIHLKDNLLTGGPAVADPEEPATQWARPLAKRVAEVRMEKEGELLDRLDAEGLDSLAETLDALQKGGLGRVAVPVDYDVEVVRCLDNDWLAVTEDALREVCGDGPIERTSLKEHLVHAARTGGADIVLVRGPEGEGMEERFGGLAGLPRRQGGHAL